MSMFVSGLSDLVVKEFHTTMLINEINICHLMIHSLQIEKEKAKEYKREKSGDDDFSNSGPSGHRRA